MDYQIKDIIQKQISGKKPSHSYLIEINDFESFFDELKEILKLFMCDNSPEICNECQHCLYIDKNEHPNIYFIKPETNYIKIDQIESLLEKLKYKTSFGNNNIYVIEGAEYLNSSSGNALLKRLEDPEDNIIAILLTKNKSQVLPTIVSRCQFLSVATDNNYIGEDIIDLANRIDICGKSVKEMLDYSKVINSLEDKTDIKKAFNYLLINELETECNQEKINLLKEIIEEMRYNVNVDLLLLKYLIRMCEINELL